MKLIILITAEREHGLTIAEAWQKAGAPGITIVQTNGLYSLQQEVKAGNIELPRMVSSMAAAVSALLAISTSSTCGTRRMAFIKRRA